MSPNSGFVENIEHPSHPDLGDALAEACNKTRIRLNNMGFSNPEEWFVRKVAFAYFYDWQQDSPNYAFVLPDPGNVGTQFRREIRKFRSAGPDISYREQVKFYRTLARGWFIDHSTDFPQEFFSLLRSNEIIEYVDNWQTYIQSAAFFDDFYMTDVLKYRVDGYKLGGDWEAVAFRRQLKRELVQIDPNVVFVFGGNAWHTIRKYLKPEPVHPPVRDRTSIMKTHGELYCTDTYINAFILPLSHMSGQVWWRFPPDDYIDRLNVALEELCEVATNGFQLSDNLCDSEDDSAREPTALDKIAEEIGEVSVFEKDK